MRMLLGMLALACGLALAPAHGQLVQVRQDFSRDPGWDHYQNRIVGTDIPQIVQDFGWRRTDFAGGGPGGERAIPFAEFHRLPGDTPHLDTNLRPDELLTAVDLPAEGFAGHYAYIKIRDRTSYAFALVSVAAALRMDGRTIREARVALGGVPHTPWRDPQAEALLRDGEATPEHFRRAAEAILRNARGYGHNDFKVELARRAVIRALTRAAEGEVRP